MADEKQLTSVQIDKDTDDKLRLIAEAYERSKAAQVRYMIGAEYEKLAAVKLLPLGNNQHIHVSTEE